MAKSKPMSTPFITNCKLSKEMGLQDDANLKIMRVIPFQNDIRSLMYAIIWTRPILQRQFQQKCKAITRVLKRTRRAKHRQECKPYPWF
jgi:hypothetical protein